MTLIIEPATIARPLTEETGYILTASGLEALQTAEIVPDEDDAEPEGFTLDTADKVDWVLSKIADARARAARIRENMGMMAKEADREAAFLEWKFGASLQAYARQELTGKKKSIRLPNGVIGFRTRPAAFIFDDAEGVKWAAEHAPELLTARLDKKALSDALTVTETGAVVVAETGECLSFANWTPADEQFYIK